MSEIFETQFAYSPANQQLIKGATFNVFDVDTGEPLATTDALGSPLVLASDGVGALPPFKVAGDRVQVEIRNGAFKTVLTTTAGVAARESARVFTDQIADPESDLNLGLTAKTVEVGAQVFSRPTTVSFAGKARTVPVFEAVGGPIFTRDASGFHSLEGSVCVVDTQGMPGTYINRFYMFFSTDHDVAGAGFNGQGGIGLATAPSILGPWTSYRPSPTEPRVYWDTVVGNQTETPYVIYVEGDPDGLPWYMYYQQENAGLNQATFLARSADLTTWTRYGLVIQGRASWPGDGQTTYFQPIQRAGKIFGRHLMGGGDWAHIGLSYSYDGRNFVTDPRRFGHYSTLVGANNDRRLSVGNAFLWRGHWYAIATIGPHSSGFQTGNRENVVVRLTDDFKVVGSPTEFLKTLPSGVTEKAGGGHVIAADGLLYYIYRANGAQGHFRCAVTEA